MYWSDDIYFELSMVTEVGFYATHYGWDVQEGSFCYSNYFDGKEWRDDKPIYQVAGPFETESEADKWCEENDIST